MANTNGKQIQILDATIRDGGLGFEDAAKNHLFDKSFDHNILEKIVIYLQKSLINIVELGSIEITQNNLQKFGIFQNVQEISKLIPKNRDKNQMYAALYRGPDTPIEDIPEWNPFYCEGIRVILRYSELEKSLNFCKALSKKGYQVFVQPMLTMRYTYDELQKIISAANEMCAYAVYFVDSYGYMQSDDIVRFFRIFDEGLEKSIRIGFHAHNNMNLAFSNAETFLNIDTDRNMIVDSCILGLGQGAGNLQTEIIVDYLNQKYRYQYNYDAVLEACELIGQYWAENIWGYSVEYFLPARHKAAYKYAVSMRHHYKMSYMEIDHVLKDMPLDLKQRYTPEDLKNYLEEWKKEIKP